MTRRSAQLIVALDLPGFKEAKNLVDILGESVAIYKVGSQLFTIDGPQVMEYLSQRGKKIFLDLKFHDIPQTVSNSTSGTIVLSVRAASKVSDHLKKNAGLFMLTVWTLGGEEMMKEAVKASREKAAELMVEPPLIVGVAVLTSDPNQKDTQEIVLEKSRLAKKCGLAGMVASANEVQAIRKEMGDDFVIVTPGIRPLGSEAGDQKRIGTPAQAIANGSDYLVVGRPIVQAADPLAAAKAIIKEMKQA